MSVFISGIILELVAEISLEEFLKFLYGKKHFILVKIDPC